MRKSITAICVFSSALLFGQDFTSDLGGGTGNWDNPATWGNVSGGAGVGYPGSGNSVLITGGDDVNYNITSGSVTYGSLTLNASGCSFAPQTGCSPAVFSSYSDVTGATISASTGAGLVTINSDVTLNGGFFLSASILINGSLDIQGNVFIFNPAVTLEISSSNGSTSLDGSLNMSDGILALTASGANDVDIAATANIIIGDGAVLYLEGNGSQHLNNAGTVTVRSGGLITISGSNNINFNNTGTLTFEYGSSFYPGLTGAKISTTGNAPNWEIDLTNDGNGHWRQIGFPFEAGTTLSILSGTDFNPNITAGQRNIYYYDADEDALNPGKAYGWTDIGDLSSTAAYSSASAYNIYTGDANYPFTNGGVVSISASVPDNVDSRSFTLYNFLDPVVSTPIIATDEGWNLVYNPFPCWIDLESVMAANTNLTYTGVHVWDAANNQYIAFLPSGELSTVSHSNSLLAGATATQYINPFQAFWVKLELTDASNENLTISLSNRTLTNSGSGYLKTKKYESLVRLNTFAVADSSWDQVLLAIDENASYDRIGSEDAYDRTPGFEVPNMSLVSTDGVLLSISTMPLDSTYTVPMEFTNAVDGAEYFIELDPSDFNAAMTILLEDEKNGIFHDLENGNYRFTHDATWGGTRFAIHLGRGSIGIDEERVKNRLTAWISGDHLLMDSKANCGASMVQVVDMSGRILYSESHDISIGRSQIALPQVSRGAHLIRVVPEFGSPIQIKHLEL
ncbi:hypothetical protein [Phaeocystidibacter marisrubri]|uniref:T9SS type A sorting domain-containing protein n=1 Tax=Phaeocystidibacter marisrubri TaxID=1577780 RepID=A0A6L3ZIH6_9FLAO|nr:hypothetical protein [Phaeocystidibacter marisrubri]KAB2817637.1 hypothetical protein F8C82_04335 [Phaeocystidibacter marisrubri]GGH74357.1 hypothetical protein GCM10011318_20250 [Phaeocystidibacter marisrubri]